MFEDIRKYVKNCDNCQRRGPTVRKEPLQPILVKAPFHRVGLDIKGPLPVTKNGNRHIIVTMDYFTKWPEARAIKDIKVETVICQHDAPEEILTDRGMSFMNQVVDQLFDLQINSVSTNDEAIDNALLNRLIILIDKLELNKQDALDNMNQTQE
ncbi:8379_t:CDS:2 [Funneliformis geosporum]|nr:8379_t:CDS:2 [Funneliformis geosporum]